MPCLVLLVVAVIPHSINQFVELMDLHMPLLVVLAALKTISQLWSDIVATYYICILIELMIMMYYSYLLNYIPVNKAPLRQGAQCL